MRRVQRGAYAAPALSAALDGSALDGRGRSLVTTLVYGTLRWLPFLDACLAPRLRDPGGLPPEVRDALRIGAFERLVAGTPPHAVANEWVAVVAERHARLGGLANAVLRRVAAPPDLADHERLALPAWLHAALHESLGAEAEGAARGMLEPEPLWLTAFGAGAREALEAEGVEVGDGPLPGTLRARSPRPLGRLTAYREGRVQPQNPAATLPVLALAVEPGERALDLASGHGVKTALLASAGARVEAFERDGGRVERATANLARLGLRAEHRVADLRSVPDVAPASAVLLDAPCSGTGTLRGHPEIKLRLGPDDLAPLAALQADLLDTAAALVLPGGRLVYAVCSLTEREGPEQVRRFLARHPSFVAETVHVPTARVATPVGCFVLPLDGLDGFFIARLREASACAEGDR